MTICHLNVLKFSLSYRSFFYTFPFPFISLFFSITFTPVSTVFAHWDYPFVESTTTTVVASFVRTTRKTARVAMAAGTNPRTERYH